MKGYIGERARRRRRKYIIFFILIIIILLIIYIFPNFKVSENIPSETLLPSEVEIQSSETNVNIEELELEIFDKKQKIIFRDQQIKKLKGEFKILVIENQELSNSINNLNKKIDHSNPNEEKEILNSKIKKIQQDKKKELKKLNDIIINITNEKNNLLQTSNTKDEQNNILKKEYKSVVSKNLKLNQLRKELQNKIKKLQNITEDLQNTIEEQNLLIKVLEDTSHHG